MVLWVDLHRPRKFNGLDLHQSVTEQLKKLAENGDLPHLLFYGPPGAGKKTRINALLFELFGPAVEKVRVVQRTVETKSKKIQISTLLSQHHAEINPSDAGNSDTIVVQDVIKDIAQSHVVTQPRAASHQPTTGTSGKNSTTTTTTMSDDVKKKQPPSYKIVVLHEVDRLSVDAQHGLRRTMELYTKQCRLILCSDSATKLTAPLKSRCFLIRIPSPTDIEIHKILTTILQKQKHQISPQLLNDIVEHADGNLRRAILCLETTTIAAYTNTTSHQPTVKLPDWEIMIFSIAGLVLNQQTPNQLLVIRPHLYQLLTSCIPADIILEKLSIILASKVGSLAGHSIVRWAAYYDERLGNSAKAVIHLEAFIAKAMAVIVYEQHVNKN
jgi:replication factor C subunit 3/5